MTGWGYIALGGALFAAGWLHRLPTGAAWDARLAARLQPLLLRYLGRRTFRLLWLWGTSPPTLIALALLAWRLRPWWAAPLAYLLVAGAERGVKVTLRRERPFRAVPEVALHQPKTPHDPSFPSGDALRVWFLALALPLLGLPLWAQALLLGLAVLVSGGRVALGAHYPLDVVAGSGLGILAAGLVWLWVR